MDNRASALLITSAICALSVTGSVAAQDYSAGKIPEGDAPARVDTAGSPRVANSAAPTQRRSPDVSRRALSDDAARVKAFGVVKRTADGTVERMDVAPGVVDTIRDGRRSEAVPGGEADMPTEAGRAVIGTDERQRVTDTSVYPYYTVGFIQASHKDPERQFSCTGALIGPRLVVTAARCIYDHDIEGGWLDDVNFWPGINGPDEIPYGSYQWEETYVLTGFIDEHDGTYDSVWPYDVALIVLDEPAGEKLGWLGYKDIGSGSPFIANIIGYQRDHGDFSQWRMDCDVPADDIRDYDLRHVCDADEWSLGAPLYVLNVNSGARHVIGLNMEMLDGKNWAIRFDEPILKWFDSHNK